MNTRIMYLRDSHYRPVGCVAISVDRKRRTLSYQLSVQNPLDSFDRSLARQLALGRLVDKPINLPYDRKGDLSMHDISTTVMKHIAASKAPSRAVKAAKDWLYDNDFGFEPLV